MINHRHKMAHRSIDELERLILNHLNRIGPMPVTELILRMELNHSLAMKVLNGLMTKGCIIQKDRFEYQNSGVPPQRRRYLKGRIANYPAHVKTLFAITDSGRVYVAMLNKIELMLCTPK